jgi:hypothetical protein
MSNGPSGDREKDAANELNDLAAELGDKAIVALTAVDVIEYMPVLKIGVAASKLVSSVRDHLLMRKLDRFLRTLAELTIDERINMVRKLEEDPDYTERVGEHLIELLDRLEGQRKPKMAGAVFAAFGREDINLRMLRRLNTAIERVPPIDIPAIRRLYDATRASAEQRAAKFAEVGENSAESLLITGLFTSSNLIGGQGIQPNHVCQAFIALNLDRV